MNEEIEPIDLRGAKPLPDYWQQILDIVCVPAEYFSIKREDNNQPIKPSGE